MSDPTVPVQPPTPPTVTAAEVDRLPVGSVVLDVEGEAWQQVDTALWVSTSGQRTASLAWEDEQEQSFRLLWVPPQP